MYITNFLIYTLIVLTIYFLLFPMITKIINKIYSGNETKKEEIIKTQEPEEFKIKLEKLELEKEKLEKTLEKTKLEKEEEIIKTQELEEFKIKLEKLELEKEKLEKTLEKTKLEKEEIEQKKKEIEQKKKACPIKQTNCNSLYEKEFKLKSKNAYIIYINTESKQNKNFDNISKIVNYVLVNIENYNKIIIKLNSHGGDFIEYSATFFEFVRLKKKGYKIKVFIENSALSGGYLVASIGNKIYCCEHSSVGSIGAYKLLCQKEVGTYKIFKSTPNKIIGLDNVEHNEEEAKMLQKKVDECHKVLEKNITKYRKIDLEKCGKGDVFSSEDAKELNMVDGIKNVNDYLLELIKTHNVIELVFDEWC